MTRAQEFKTKIEVAGDLMDALIRYECDPEDGWPIIRAVAVGRGRFLIDITRLLDEYQLHVFSSEIHDALNADRNALRIEQMERERASA